VPGDGTRPRVRLTGPGALVACLPQLIGFPPVESVVLVGLVPAPNGRRQVGLTLRVDLDAVLAVSRPVGPAHDRADQADDPSDDAGDDATDDTLIRGAWGDASHPCHPLQLAAAVRRNQCVAAQIVIVSDRVTTPPNYLGDDPVSGIADDVGLALTGLGVSVADALAVRDGRWWSYLCTNPTCCPAEGTLIQPADSDAFAAERAWVGEPAQVLADRSVIVERVAPATGVLRDEVASALAPGSAPAPRPPEDALAGIADLIDAHRDPQPEVSPATWAQLLVDLTTILVRDACLAPWKGTTGEAGLRLWCSATRLAPPGHVAAPATLAGVLAHARGEGALAGEAFARALDDDPGYRLARYSAQSLAGGLPPTLVRQTVVSATATIRARGEPVLDARGRLVPGRGPASTVKRRRRSPGSGRRTGAA
jgi:Domain of unknown function (DUF4192)